MDRLDPPPPAHVGEGARRPAGSEVTPLTGKALEEAIAPTLHSVAPPAPLLPELDEALVGTSLGSFKLIRKLGRGGMGTVYLAQHEAIGSLFAVKVLHPHLASDPRLVARFHAEARAVGIIGHKNIVNIFDVGVRPPGIHYLLMEYLDGQPLSSLKGPAPLEVVLPILVQICDALEAAHGLGIIHRDLKPDNMFLVRRDGTERFVKVLDFGVARMVTGNQPSQTSAGVIVGTPDYMAPEQYLSAQVDGRSDIYSLGVIAFQLTTGRLPFTGSSTDVLTAHRERPPPCPRELNPALPATLSDVILCALAKQPQERFQTAAAFREALLAVAEGCGGALGRMVPPAQRTPPALEAVFRDASGQQLGRLRCIQLTRGGLFACTDEELPPLFSRLTLSLRPGGGELTCPVEVVRHVRPSEVSTWGMPAGFGVQFVDVKPAFKEAFARILQGKPLPRGDAASAPAGDDPGAEPVLAELLARNRLDPYAFLSLAKNASMGDIRRRGREDQRRLEALRGRPLSAVQAEKLSACQERLSWVLSTLGRPIKRAEYDARQGNFQGVARCIAAGLGPGELDGLRQRHLADNRGAEAKAAVHVLTARSLEANSDERNALREYERALALDPLNLELQRAYWGLMRRQQEGSASGRSAPGAHREPA